MKVNNLMPSIREGLRAAGKDEKALKAADFNGFDEFHTGGHASTVHLMEQLNLSPVMRTLDIGCGVGGAARYVAEKYGAQVTGIDLSPEFTAAAIELSAMAGLSNRTIFKTGDATALPFDNGAFDAAWTIHVSMNILDKAAYYREAHRVLRAGALFGIFDIMRERNGAFTYPVPWAASQGQSFLATASETEVQLRNAGFESISREERRGFALAILEKAVTAPAHPLGRQLVMGEDHVEKVRNLKYNIEQKLCSPWVMICRK